MNSRTERFELRLEPELLQRVDDWRAAQRDLPNRSAAVRRLIERGLGGQSGAQQFQTARFQVLSAAKAGINISPSYAYAWDTGVFPVFHDLVPFHGPFAAHFELPAEQVIDLAKYLDEQDLADKVPTFYQLEERLGIRSGRSAWDRSSLIAACRYMRLAGRFGGVWEKVLAPGDHPIEAQAIVETFDPVADIHLG